MLTFEFFSCISDNIIVQKLSSFSFFDFFFLSKVKLPTAPAEQFVLYFKVKFYVENIALLRLVLSSNPRLSKQHAS